jgi:Na+-transporting methylmalonyl-CoA/oxaloacetate decarboxylase gamma subunit
MLNGIVFMFGSVVMRLHRVSSVLLILVFLTNGIAAAASATPPEVSTDESVKAFTLQWYEQMQAGKFDRTQYAATYGAQLTPEAVQAMSQHLNRYGASPLRAEIMKERSAENQKFYLVKFIFPRGDATSLLFGFDAEGKITGIGVESMAGD